MRVLHTSDWHLGRSFHSHDILDHQRAFVEWLIDYVAAHDIELVVVAGDVYDRTVPPLAAVGLWESAVIGLTRACPVLVTSGNHDSPTRLGFAGPLLAGAGLHLRTSVSTIAEPLVITGSDGVVLAAYGIPYLEPDLTRADLDADRSHEGVLRAATDRIRDDLSTRDGVRSLVAAHAFVTDSGEALVSESERDLRVGGIGDAPRSVFAGFDYVALGHLHGAQPVGGPTVRYSGSPLAFSFSEEFHAKSVTVLDIPASGEIVATLVPAPVPRPLRSLRGTLAEILADPSTPEFGDHWVRVVLTDTRRPDNPMAQLRDVFPHIADLRFEESARSPVHANDATGAPLTDPIDIATAFVEHVTAAPASSAERSLIRESVERLRIAEAPS